MCAAREAWERFEAVKERGSRVQRLLGHAHSRSISEAVAQKKREDIAGADAPAEYKNSPVVRSVKDDRWK